ncbi:MAG TPA: sensor histidine kinase [Thioalkalivibrio sp.]|nr:sensor histidine kinase [Thioalkalivibrio sp.]
MRTTTPGRDVATESRDCFLPNFCTARAVFLVVLIAELLACMLALVSATHTGNLWTDLGLISLFVQWVALGSAGALCVIRRYRPLPDPRVAAMVGYGTTLGMALGVSLLTLAIERYAGAQAVSSELSPTLFVLRNLAITTIVATIVFRYFYVHHQWAQNVEAEARARVQALTARIRPHFLFNSMNTIASLTRTHPDQAEEAVHDLADMFRATLDKRERIGLDEEIEITRRYLAIEQLRLDERLTIEWHIDEHLPRGITVPALVIQPLVENAIYHGIEPLTQGGIVQIRIEGAPQGLRVLVSNPLGQETRRSQGNHMAQDNIRQRLALAYGEQSELHIEQSEDTYTVCFTIPGE